MRVSKQFEPSATEIAELVHRFPLAQVISNGGDGLMATPLPLMLICDQSPWTLLGHFARSNPHVLALQEDPQALVIFAGPHGYVSPSWMRDRTQAPTWNFATVHFNAVIKFEDSISAAKHSTDTLTTQMEAGRAAAWAPHEMGLRQEVLLRAIMPFRATVRATRSKFKLGQNERPDILADIVTTLERAPDCSALVDLMVRANKSRLSAA